MDTNTITTDDPVEFTSAEVLEALDESYSAHLICETPSRIAGLVLYAGEHYVCTGMDHRGCKTTCQIQRVIPRAAHTGPVYDYHTKPGRVAGPTFYENMGVKYKGRDYVLVPPERHVTVRAAPEPAPAPAPAPVLNWRIRWQQQQEREPLDLSL